MAINLIQLNAFEYKLYTTKGKFLQELWAFNGNELNSRVGCDRSAQLSAINNWSGRYVHGLRSASIVSLFEQLQLEL